MSKITIIEPNTNDKDQTRNYFVKGEKGYSAYELYVQNGGTMTEAQWLDAFLNADNYYSKSETDTLLGAKVNTSDIKDNLTSTDTNKPLSAKQGKELKNLIDNTYTKTQSDAKYLLNDNLLILTGSGTTNADGLLDISTSGFNASNSTILSVMISLNNTSFRLDPDVAITSSGVEIDGEFVSFVAWVDTEYYTYFSNSGLSFMFNNQSNTTIYYKIVLLKTS